MKKYTCYTMILSILASAMSMNVQGKVRTVESERDFQQRVSKSPIAVALFYQQATLGDFLKMYEKVSSKKDYDDADITFLKINTSTKGLGQLMETYSITELPTFILFKRGDLVVDANGKMVQLTGFATNEELQNFIENNCGGKIDFLIEKKEEADEQRREDRARVDPYWTPEPYVPYWRGANGARFGVGVGLDAGYNY